MFDNLSSIAQVTHLKPTIPDSKLSFSQYIDECRALIEERRTDLATPDADLIINANSPFELYPDHPPLAGQKLKYGVLFIHGLFDSPFSLRDIATHLQAHGVLSRGILLPGHGTTPSDLINVGYEDWVNTMRYGIESLRPEVEKIFLVGYSTGATLSIYQALQDKNIAGIILLSPAVRIKAPVNVAVESYYLLRTLTKNKKWIYREKEIDYVKYRSVPFNPVQQVANLTDIIYELTKKRSLTAPIFMAVSREDETISSHSAIDFFNTFHHPNSELLLYSSIDHIYPDQRILTRVSRYPNLHINHFSHIAIPFNKHNYHYGENGDYVYASHPDKRHVYGAYNRFEMKFFNTLYQLGLIKRQYEALTYNPDFDFMMERMLRFILG